METESPDPGVSSATPSRPRPHLHTAGVAVLAFALGGMTVSAVPLAVSLMDAEPVIYSIVRIEPKQSLLAAKPGFEDARREQVLDLKFHQEFIRSDRVLKAALASPELRKIEVLNRDRAPVNWIREHLQVDVPEDTPFIRLSIRGAEPHEQVLLVNQVTSSFIRAFSEYQEGSNTNRLRVIEKALDTAREVLAARRKSLLESEAKGDGVKASVLRDEIAVKEDLFKRLLTVFEEMKLDREIDRELVRVDLVYRAELPTVK